MRNNEITENLENYLNVCHSMRLHPLQLTLTDILLIFKQNLTFHNLRANHASGPISHFVCATDVHITLSSTQVNEITLI